MKKINELKLNQLIKTELEKKQMISLKGGEECSCSCSSGLYNGMTQLQGYMSHRCDGKECSCSCDQENYVSIKEGDRDNIAIL